MRQLAEQSRASSLSAGTIVSSLHWRSTDVEASLLEMRTSFDKQHLKIQDSLAAFSIIRDSSEPAPPIQKGCTPIRQEKGTAFFITVAI